MIDWTMIENAADASERIRAIVYLCILRYELDAKAAGTVFAEEVSTVPERRQVIEEIRRELADSFAEVGIGTLVSEDMARSYLTELLKSFDDATEKEK